MRPPLAEELVGQASVGVLPVGIRLEVHLLHEVLAVEERHARRRLSHPEDAVAPLRERRVTDLARHLIGGAKRAEVKRADHGVRAVVVLVVGLVLRPLDESVRVGVLLDQKLHRLAHPRPDALEERAVARDLVFPKRLEDVAALRVARPQRPAFPAEADGAGLGEEPDARREILHLAHRALELGKQPRHGVRVVPHVPAGAVTASGAFPGPEPSVPPPLRRRRGQVGGGRVQPVEQPVRERRVVVRPVPESRAPGQRMDVPGDVPRHVARIVESLGVVVADEPVLTPHVGHVPGEHEGDAFLRDWAQRESARDGDREWFSGGLLGQVAVRRFVGERAWPVDDEDGLVVVWLEALAVAAGGGAYDLAVHDEVDAGAALVAAAADEEADVRPLDREGGRPERAVRPVAAEECVDQALSLEAADGLLVRQRARGRGRSERLAVDAPPAVGSALEIGKDDRQSPDRRGDG